MMSASSEGVYEAYRRITEGEKAWQDLIEALGVEAHDWYRLTWVEEEGRYVYGVCAPTCVVWMSTSLGQGHGIGIGCAHDGVWIEGYAGQNTLLLAELAWHDDVGATLREEIAQATSSPNMVT